MFFIFNPVSSRISFCRVFSKMSNQWSFVSFFVLMKSLFWILPPGTHHFPGKTFSFGLLLQIKYLPSEFRIIPVTAT